MYQFTRDNSMKKVIVKTLLALTIIMCATIVNNKPASAATATYGFSDSKVNGIKWAYKITDAKNKKVDIRPADLSKLEGKMLDITFPSSIKINKVSYTVSGIGYRAFYCSLGACKNSKDLEKQWYDCDGEIYTKCIKSAIIPSTIEKIRDDAFSDEYNIQYIEFQGVPKYISEGAFDLCKVDTVIMDVKGWELVKKFNKYSFFDMPDEFSRQIFSKQTLVIVHDNQTKYQIGKDYVISMGNKKLKSFDLNDFEGLNNRGVDYEIVTQYNWMNFHSVGIGSDIISGDSCFMASGEYRIDLYVKQKVKETCTIKSTFKLFDNLDPIENSLNQLFTYSVKNNQVVFSSLPTDSTFEKTGYHATSYKLYNSSNGISKIYKPGAKASNLLSNIGTMADATLNYEPNTYTIKYNPSSQQEYFNSIKDTKCTYDKEAKITTLKPSWDGYEFTGWSAQEGGEAKYQGGQTVKNLTDKNGDVVNLYSSWKAKKATLHLNANGGTLSGTTSFEFSYGEPISKTLNLDAKVPVREGYKFKGWYLSTVSGTKVSNSFVIQYKNDFTIYAQWEKIKSKVTFNMNGADGGNITRACDYGERVGSLPTVKRSGYTFLGWFTAADAGSMISAYKIIKDDSTFYAHWKEITKKIWITVTIPSSGISYDGYTVTYSSDRTGSVSRTYNSSQSVARISIPGAKVGEKYVIEVKCFYMKGNEKIYFNNPTVKTIIVP